MHLKPTLAALGLAASLTAAAVSAASAAPLPATTAPASQWTTWAQTTVAENTGYWKPIMGVKFYPPGLKFLGSTPIQSACGPVSANDKAMYCPRDSSIYVSTQFLAAQERSYGAHAAQLILDHEFGHHIQNLQGLPWRGMYSELQADCLAGAAITSQWSAEKVDAPSTFATIANTSSHAGDPNRSDYDHGTGYERVSALIDGWNDLGHCSLTEPNAYYYPNLA